jgi:hypothetical protein
VNLLNQIADHRKSQSPIPQAVGLTRRLLRTWVPYVAPEFGKLPLPGLVRFTGWVRIHPVVSRRAPRTCAHHSELRRAARADTIPTDNSKSPERPRAKEDGSGQGSMWRGRQRQSVVPRRGDTRTAQSRPCSAQTWAWFLSARRTAPKRHAVTVPNLSPTPGRLRDLG